MAISGIKKSTVLDAQRMAMEEIRKSELKGCLVMQSSKEGEVGLVDRSGTQTLSSLRKILSAGRK